MPATPATSPHPARYENGRFGPGNPGRRPGARGRTANRVTMAILEDFLEHKDETLKYARRFRVEAYLNTVLKLLPSQAAIEAPEVRAWSDADVDSVPAHVRGVFERAGQGRDVLIELEAILLGEGPAERLPASLDHRINGD
jgi:hypothetical protein